MFLRAIIVSICLYLTALPLAHGAGDEIIVTAKRLAEDNQTYAGTVAVLDKERLETIAAIHPAESLNAVAGVNIHRGSGQEHLTAIRSPVLTGGAGAGSFLYLEDGVPLRAAGFANVNGLFEAGTEFAERLEVVKGPGSVLYGSNAVHGLINVISEPPKEDFGGQIRLMGSDDGLVSLSGSLTNSGARLSASVVHDNGFREDSGFDQQKAQFRYDMTFGDWDAKWLTSFQNLNQETAGFIQGVRAYEDEDISKTNPNPEAFRDGRSLRSQIRLDKKISDNQTLSFTPYARWTDLEFLRHFVPGQALEKNDHSSIGLLSALYGDSYVLGVDAEYTQGSLFEFQDNPDRFSFIQGEHYDYDVEAVVLSAYAQRDFWLDTRLKLDVGLRADYTHYDYDNKIDSGVFGRFRRVDDRSDDFFTLTPKAGLTYQYSDDISFYGRLARGARAPQTSDLYSVQINQEPGDANVETLDSAEVGAKGQLGDFNFELAAFVMRKDNFFFRNANGFNVTDGKTNHQGIELAFNGALTRWLSLGGDLTLAKHTYDFTDIVGSPSSSIVDGDDVDTAPNTLANLRLTARPVDSLMTQIEWRHVGSYFTDPGNTTTYPGHDIFVLRSEWGVSDNIMLFARVDNLFDTRYADRADFAFGNERYFPGRPRTLFLGIKSGF